MKTNPNIVWNLAAISLVIYTATPLPSPDCPAAARCGGMEIPYPFGLTPNCSFSPSFLIACRNSTPFYALHPFTRISLPEGSLTLRHPFLRHCAADPDPLTITTQPNFAISTKNKITVIGCNALAAASGYGDIYYELAGVALCSDSADARNGSCAGVGCGQIGVPVGLRELNVSLLAFDENETAKVEKFNPCGYAMVVEEKRFNFSRGYLKEFGEKDVAMVLDWVIGKGTCEEAQKNQSGFACKAESSGCIESANPPGYRCKCKDGYHGNPYLEGGCRDIDECSDPVLNRCENGCHNTPGSFVCYCSKPHRGNNTKDHHQKDCIHKSQESSEIRTILAAVLSFVAAVIACSWLYFARKKRNLIRLREEFFRKNGGIILKQRLSTQGSPASIKIFSISELQNATCNFDDARILGEGGFGTVYKGVFTDGSVLAIKKSTRVSENQVKTFINELIVLSQINHRNVVKLLGCCLEAPVPLLVYEFISNGTLSNYVHGPGNRSEMCWKNRLRIAKETACALAYLHSEASTPIIHRDVKSANILLDENFATKVSDFGISRLVPMNQSQLATIVQGTIGYIDPEYVRTSRLTSKSDVYSFGVVLAELLTGKEALSFARPETERTVALLFLSYLEKERLDEVLDDSVVNRGNDEQIKEVSELARKCLSIKGDERPSMKEVAVQLEIIEKNGGSNPPLVDDDEVETMEEDGNMDNSSNSGEYNNSKSVYYTA